MQDRDTDYVVFPPKGKRAAVERLIPEIMAYLGREFPEWCFGIMTIVDGESDEFSVIPIVGFVGDAEFAPRKPMPPMHIAKEAKYLLKRFDLGAAALN
ncbi:hypothetical protein [Terrarubrum flagellatum]|uniref:hypothetical protein n=1 Tax=Terrirubrum flagellatum TaxID=2895980 RepID=UPI0031450082